MKLSKLVTVALLAAACCANGVPTARADADTLRRSFNKELSAVLLNSQSTFVDLGDGVGWRGVVLASPGSSIAPLTEAYNGLPGSLQQYLANSAIFDRPVSVIEGFAELGQRPLSAIWKDVLEETRPHNPLPRDRVLSSATMKWLFKPIYKRGKIVGYTREPSKYLARYKEFQSQYKTLVLGKASELWKLDPRLKKYRTFDQARETLLKDWAKSGFKAEVESATWTFEASSTGPEWQRWMSANEDYNSHLVPIDGHTLSPETYLFPPPAAWSTVSSWIRATSQSDGGQVYHYQLARIKIARPWLDIDDLISGDLKARTANVQQISDGKGPSDVSFPSGRIPAFIEELIIVRDIKPSGVTAAASQHPLASFAYPDGINLVGYVVRVLPATPIHGDSVNSAAGGLQ
ncbi:hypothetical protein [Mesorhizobium erdmanii]|uniref:hypothetical protein n=1 Tax=Mesorhizobium erdmanii TaxID=1777866 RepID=UPI0003F9B4E6|nr:hypothetical protein [Mesorhizobium erdmanii]